MKLVLFFFLFFPLHADFLNTLNNRCVYDVYPKKNIIGLCYTDRKKNKIICNKNLSYSDLIDGYEVVSTFCVLNKNLSLTGIKQDDWNQAMIILANALGFTMFLLVNYLVALVARG